MFIKLLKCHFYLLIMRLRLLSVLRGAGSVVDDSLSIVAAIVL